MELDDVTAGATPDASTAETQSTETDAGTAAPDDLALARALILKAHPEIVPELVTGASLAEMLASVPAAEAAWARVIETARGTAIPSPADRERGTAVPSGGGVRSAGVNLDGLGPMAKIRAGLSRS